MLSTESTGDEARAAGADFSIRLATPDDASGLTVAGRNFFRDTFGSANRPEDMEAYLTSAFNESRQRAELAEPGARGLLATGRGGDIVG